MRRELSNGEYEILGLEAAKEEIENAVLYEIFVTVDFMGNSIPLEIKKKRALRLLETIATLGPAVKWVKGLHAILHVQEIDGGFLSISFVDSEMAKLIEERDPI